MTMTHCGGCPYPGILVSTNPTKEETIEAYGAAKEIVELLEDI